MKAFLAWFEAHDRVDPVVKTGVAPFWFVTIHSFEDGNGRIGRAIADLGLARADRTAERFYSMSSQIARPSVRTITSNWSAASGTDST